MGIILDAKPTSAGDRKVFVCPPPLKTHHRSFSIWTGSVVFLFILILFISVPFIERQVLNLGAWKLPPTAAPLIKFHHALSALDRQLSVATAEYENASSMDCGATTYWHFLMQQTAMKRSWTNYTK